MLSWPISEESLGEVSILPVKFVLSPGASGDSGGCKSHRGQWPAHLPLVGWRSRGGDGQEAQV